MIGIVKLFPIEVFLTRELQLFVWNERLNSICIRVLLQKKRGVGDEWSIHKSCVLRQKGLNETSCQQLWSPASIALKVVTREKKCVGIKSAKKKWAVHVFLVRCQWERGAGHKRQKEIGQLGKKVVNVVLDKFLTTYWFDIHNHVLSAFSMNSGPRQP